MIDVECAKCGAPFTNSPSRHRVSKSGKFYCSTDCWYSRNSASVTSPTSDLQSCVCFHCGKKFKRGKGVLLKSKRIFCSTACYHAVAVGDGMPNWAGGRWLDGKGYWRINIGPQLSRAEHVVIAERALGRPLGADEMVHHINIDKTDNRPENLLVCTRSYHAWLHHEMARLWALEHLPQKPSELVA